MIGIAARAAPLFDFGGRLLRQWPTEDGYFMLTIARNLAIGRGFAVAGGEIPTNGTQPLTTLIWSGLFWAADGDRSGGVFLVLLLEVAISIATAYLVFALARHVFALSARAESIAWLASAAWFASPLVVPNSMNCLETGAYGMIAVAVGLVFIRESDELWSWKKTALVGVLLGVAFWVRNDACFLILAACLTHVWIGLPEGRDVVQARFTRTLVFGSISVLIASPWLIFNYVSFGSIMPVSGRAESLTSSFGSNLDVLPPVMLEYVFGVLPIPHSVQETLPVIAASVVGLLAMSAVALVAWGRARRRLRVMMVFAGLYALGLCSFYGLYFGAGWFMARYLFPLSGFMMVFWAAMVFHLAGRARAVAVAHALVPVAAGLLAVVITGLHVRVYRQGEQHMHFQVVKWLEEHVDADTWVGAIQTGTIGFFHDRTINLDGKVNIAAYEAMRDARIGEYVAYDTKIRYLADWAGLVDWMNMKPIADNFEVSVHRPAENLAVLTRKKAK